MVYQVKKDRRKKKMGRKKLTVDGLKMNPKFSHHQNLIEVKEIIVIESSLKEQVLKRQFQVAFRRLFKMVANTLSSDEATEGDIKLALDEILKVKKVLQSKYKHQISNEEYRIMWNKVYLLQKKASERLVWLEELKKNYTMYYQEELEEKKGRGR